MNDVTKATGARVCPERAMPVVYDRTKVPYPCAVHPRFNAGQVWVTSKLMAACSAARVRECLGRHVRGDWGIVSSERVQANAGALRLQQTVRSAYAVDPTLPCSDLENCLQIVTDGQAGATLLLLAGESEVWP